MGTIVAPKTLHELKKHPKTVQDTLFQHLMKTKYITIIELEDTLGLSRDKTRTLVHKLVADNILERVSSYWRISKEWQRFRAEQQVQSTRESHAKSGLHIKDEHDQTESYTPPSPVTGIKEEGSIRERIAAAEVLEKQECPVVPTPKKKKQQSKSKKMS